MSVLINNGKIINVHGAAMIINTDGKCIVNGKQISLENGEYDIDGIHVEVSELGASNHVFTSSGDNYVSASAKQCEHSDGWDGDDYRIHGIRCTIKKNIYVGGDVNISGMFNTVKSGRPVAGYEDLVIKGNLEISGMYHDIGNIVKIGGSVSKNGIYNNVR